MVQGNGPNGNASSCPPPSAGVTSSKQEDDRQIRRSPNSCLSENLHLKTLPSHQQNIGASQGTCRAAARARTKTTALGLPKDPASHHQQWTRSINDNFVDRKILVIVGICRKAKKQKHDLAGHTNDPNSFHHDSIRTSTGTSRSTGWHGNDYCQDRPSNAVQVTTLENMARFDLKIRVHLHVEQ